MDLDQCIKEGTIRKVKPDNETAKSLVEMSDVNEEVVRSIEPVGTKAIVRLTLAYDALREVMEAIAISRGYKITNHVCLGIFIEDNVTGFDKNTFHRARMIRNDINYQGKFVDTDICTELSEKLLKIKKDLIKELD